MNFYRIFQRRGRKERKDEAFRSLSGIFQIFKFLQIFCQQSKFRNRAVDREIRQLTPVKS